MSKVVKGVKKFVFGSSPKVSYAGVKIPSPSAFERELADRLKGLYGGLLSNIDLSGLYGQTISDLNRIRAGELPQSYQDAINQFLTTTGGGLLNRLAQRGILNSSVTSKTLSDALLRANELRANYLNQAARLSTFPFVTTQEALNLPMTAWRTMLLARYRVPSVPYVKGGSGGLLGSVLSGFGRAAGGWLGGKIF